MQPCTSDNFARRSWAMGNSNTKEADEEPPVSGVQVTAGLVRQLEGRSPPDTQAKPDRRAGPAWLPHLRPAGPPASSEFTNAADRQGSPQSQLPPAAQTSDQHDSSMQDAKHQVQQQVQMRDIKLEGTAQQEVNRHADQLVKEYEVPLKALPCQDEKTECLLCYQSNQQDPLRCAAQVDAFTKCARKASAVMVKALEGSQNTTKGKQLPQSLATALDNVQTKRGQSTKIKRMMRIVKEALQRPEGPQKVIVFSSFVEALHIMADTLAHSKLGFVMLHDQMDLHERAQALTQFRENPGTVVLLASLLASGTGITVTCASEVVLMEPYWNPFVEHHAIDRVHRIGQEHDVTVHRLFMAGTIEEKIIELQERKIKMMGAITEPLDGTTLKKKGNRMAEADWNALLS